jgi:hypothetical protein
LSRDNPKWEVVHVEFRRKFDKILKLDTLKAHGLPGKPLENLQTLRQSRVSVSRVTPKEWEFIMSLIDPPKTDEEEKAADAAPVPKSTTDKETSEANNVVNGQASGETGIVNGSSTSGPFTALMDGVSNIPAESETTKSKFSFF